MQQETMKFGRARHKEKVEEHMEKVIKDLKRAWYTSPYYDRHISEKVREEVEAT